MVAQESDVHCGDPTTSAGDHFTNPTPLGCTGEPLPLTWE